MKPTDAAARLVLFRKSLRVKENEVFIRVESEILVLRSRADIRHSLKGLFDCVRYFAAFAPRFFIWIE